MKKKVYNLLINNKIVFNIVKFLYDIYYYFIKLTVLGTLFKIFPIKKNKVVVCSYFGKGYGDNPKAIVNELLKSKKDLDIVWTLDGENKNATFPEGIRTVRYESIKYLYELVTAKVWIDNSRKKFVPKKRKKQYYIQTWHAGLGFKKCEKEVEDVLPKSYVKRAKKDSINADLFTSNSKWLTNLYRKYFWYDGEILEVGLPRNDILINQEKHDNIKKDVKKKLKIDAKSKIILYAPTFRDYDDYSCYKIDVEKVISTLNEKTGDNWVFLVRFHPNVSKLASELGYKNVIDVSYYPDLYELLITADYLISDYSSLSFDFSYLKKPVFLFATDIEAYKKDRDFLFDIRKVPFVLSESNEELINNIKKFDNKKYQKDLIDFYDDIKLNETGKSAHEVAKIVLKEMGIE